MKDTRCWMYHADHEPTMFDAAVDNIQALRREGWRSSPAELGDTSAVAAVRAVAGDPSLATFAQVTATAQYCGVEMPDNQPLGDFIEVVIKAAKAEAKRLDEAEKKRAAKLKAEEKEAKDAAKDAA